MHETPGTLRFTKQIWTTVQTSAYRWPQDKTEPEENRKNVQGAETRIREEGEEKKKIREEGRKNMRGGGLFISLIMRDRSEAQVHSGMVWVREKNLAGRAAY